MKANTDIINYHIDNDKNLIIGTVGTGRQNAICELAIREIKKGNYVFIYDSDMIMYKQLIFKDDILDDQNQLTIKICTLNLEDIVNMWKQVFESQNQKINQDVKLVAIYTSTIDNIDIFSTYVNDLREVSKNTLELYAVQQLPRPKIKSIYYYMDDIEFPDNDIILNGVKNGNNFVYVSETYLNGFINYVNIIDVYMIRRYKCLETENKNYSKDDISWEKSCENVDTLSNDKNHCHFNHDSHNFDDMLILAKGDNSYWIFWDDCDCSDCCIGRVPISTFNSDEDAKLSLKLEAMEIMDLDIEKDLPQYILDENIKQIPLSLFKGWITL